MIDERHIEKIACELGLRAHQVKAAAVLLDEGGDDPVYLAISKGGHRVSR